MNLLYVQDSSLVAKHWNGDAFGDEELIATSVKPDSAAAYVLTDTTRYAFFVNDASKLGAVAYDADEEEWVPIDKFPNLPVAPAGQVTAGIDEGKLSVFFQNASGQLVHLDEQWKATILPASGVTPGSPLAIMYVDGKTSVLYVTEGAIHGVRAGEAGKWEMISFTGGRMEGEKLVRMVPSAIPTEKGLEYAVFALTSTGKLVKLSLAEKELETLGTVSDSGRFVAKSSAENAMSYGSSSFIYRNRQPPPFFGTWEDLERRSKMSGCVPYWC